MNTRFLNLAGLILITLLVAVAPIKGQTQRVTNADSGRDNSEVVKVHAELAVDKTGQMGPSPSQSTSGTAFTFMR